MARIVARSATLLKITRLPPHVSVLGLVAALHRGPR